MSAGRLKIATCQFAVGSSISKNAARIRRFLEEAKSGGAEIAHFPECALSGYGGTDFVTLVGYDWELLREETLKIMELAGKLRLWVALGSMHRLTGPNKPHNCLYLIGPDGKIAERYDKRFCTPADMEFYTPGNRFVCFEINGVRCALLVCYDLRFPEIYRSLKREGAEVILQSFYNARTEGKTIHTDIMRQTMQCHAATNYFWVSMANSSGYYAPYPSCFIQPDGKIAGQMPFNRAGMMINTVDANEKLYDASGPFRELAMKGMLSNGPQEIADPRSKDTKNI